MSYRPTLRLAALFAIVMTGACSSDSSSPTEPVPTSALQLTVQEDVAVFTQNVVPEATMEALYEGVVNVDGAGCLRLATPEAHTVIWPVGYGVRSEGPDRVVHDDQGNPAGTIGEAFSLPGGEVTELSDALGFTEDDRALADSRCPGRYWIAG